LINCQTVWLVTAVGSLLTWGSTRKQTNRCTNHSTEI
jgi:hypothetical protein